MANAPPIHARPGWYDELIKAHLPAIQKRSWIFARSPHEADDIVNDTVEHALKHWHSYTPGRNFYGWCCLVMRAAVYKARRKKRISTEDTEAEISIDANQDAATDLGVVREALADIPDGGMLIEHAAGFDYSEIGERFGVSRQRIEQRVKRARNRLRKKVGG
ncbi:sigma-70 family RNA polymerase sigma factor [Pseudohoeflea suaedae]|nr:sigma-70 family RNA polymerase sigma factor [Pseudohoeflea suaedae]